MRIIRDATFDGRVASNIWQGQRWLMQCVSGNFVVRCTEGAKMAAHGDVARFLRTAHYDVLKTAPVFFHEPGDSLYMPLGSNPLILSVPTTSKSIAEFANERTRTPPPPLTSSVSTLLACASTKSLMPS